MTMILMMVVTSATAIVMGTTGSEGIEGHLEVTEEETARLEVAHLAGRIVQEYALRGTTRSAQAADSET